MLIDRGRESCSNPERHEYDCTRSRHRSLAPRRRNLRSVGGRLSPFGGSLGATRLPRS
jgi:hypothetical protein